MDTSHFPAKPKRASTVLNVQSRAAIAEKNKIAQMAAIQRSQKQSQQPPTPDHECSATSPEPAVTKKHVSQPILMRAQHSSCVVRHLSLELSAEVSLPKVKENSQNATKKNTAGKSTSPKKWHDRGVLQLHEDSSILRATAARPSERSESMSFQATKKSQKKMGLHWKSSSGNVISVDKPVFLTEMEEQVSPSKNVFQNTLIKHREGSVVQTLQANTESLIVSASRLCLASHSSSHRTSSFWFDATIALAGMSQDSLEPVLRYFNRSIAQDIKSGHAIAALIKALNDLSDAYQEFLFSWVGEQQTLFMSARIMSQTDWFNDSLKSNYDYIEKMCFVANEVIAFLEEPDIPVHSKFEQIELDKKDLKDMLTLSHQFDISEPETVSSDFEEHIATATRHVSQAAFLDHTSVHSIDLGKDESTTEDDDCDHNVADVSYEQHVMEINVASHSKVQKVSIVVAAARKYLTMKVELRNNMVTGRSAQSILPSRDEKGCILASRVAYLHTCKTLSVAPLPEVFLSLTDDEIILRHYMLGMRGCIALSAGCCKFPVLKLLDLQNCMITVAGCLLLSEAVAHCSMLQHVNIGFCIPTSESGNCEELGSAVANFTMPSNNLSELILSNNSIIGIPIIRWDYLQSDINNHLLKLDLSHCMLGCAACNPLSRVIQKLVVLKYLNLRWNKFHGDAICKLIHVLAMHNHIFDIDLSWNSCINNKSSAAIQQLLFQNAALSTLNLSFCNMKPMHATIISAGYMANQTLQKFFVEGNPIGKEGSLAFLKVSSSEYNEEARVMSLAGCNTDFYEVDVELFDFLHPSCESRKFDLMNEYDWACVFMLCATRCECSLEIFTKASLNAELWSIPGNQCDQNLWALESDALDVAKEKLVFRTKHITKQRRFIFEMIPKSGVLTLSVDFVNPPNVMSETVFANNIKLISRTSHDDGALFSKKFVKLAMHSMSNSLMTSLQAKQLLGKIDDGSAKAEFIANMIGKIVDKDEFVLEIDKLPKDISKKLKIDLKEILAFNPSNASGRYSFDMELFADRIVLQKLLEVNIREKTFRQKLRSGNTSRFGDWENIRNVTLNGHEMSFTSSWQPPKTGKISCDYTCVIRPPKSAKPIDSKCLENWIEGLSKFVSVRLYRRDEPVIIPEVCDTFTTHNVEIIHEGVSWLSNNFYLSCTQLDRVLHAFLMAGPSMMTEVVQRLFPRILDLGKFRAVLLKYFSQQNYVQVMNRIGWLNAANSIEVDGYYLLDLAVPEQRDVAIVLVDLAVQEPGENWQDEEYDGKPFELPKSWTLEVPYQKFLSMKYYTGPNCALQHVRSNWSKKFLFDSSTTEDSCDLGNDEEGDGCGTVYSFRQKAEADQSAQGEAAVAHANLSSAEVTEILEGSEQISEEIEVVKNLLNISSTEVVECPLEESEEPEVDTIMSSSDAHTEILLSHDQSICVFKGFAFTAAADGSV